MSISRLIPLLLLTTLMAKAASVTYTNSVSADAFVRANAPALNYGGAGALSVSGAAATNAQGTANGVFDSFVRFNTSALVTTFNNSFGSNRWEITSAKLRITEQGTSLNALFNRGVGPFAIYWIGKDNWIEGTGNPNAPATSGIAYQDEPSLLNPTNDLPLGVFTNAGADVTLSFQLALPSLLLSDIMSGTEVGFYFKALDPGTGFTFSSRTLPNTGGRPYLEVTAVNKPVINSLELSGQDLIVTASNGLPGVNAILLAAPDVTTPASSWLPLATNQISAGGTVTFTTPAQPASPARFFLIRSP